MVDVTQSMACIQCGACVSDCLSMEVDPLFIGPAALAKAYRFVGDPRDAQHYERLKDLAEDPHGIYDCTHCFKCIEACPKGVAPMSQIMRLRRIAGNDFDIDDRNNGHRHEHAFVKNIEKNGLLHEADLLPDSYGGKFHPRAVPELVGSLPVIAKALLRGKVTPAEGAAAAKHARPKKVRKIFDAKVEGRDERFELNLYITGYDEDDGPPPMRRPPGGPAVARTRTPAHEGRLLARLREPRVHPGAARLDGGKVAPLLDIELIELDRANCCGAGVIAEHNQELADTLNARTFALAQQTDGELMMNICSTCQGAQTECQERLDANAEYRAHINENLSDEGLDLREGPHQQELPLAAGRGHRPRRAAERVKRPLTDLKVGPFYGCYIVRPTRPPRHRRRAPARHLPRPWSSRPSAARSSTTPACTSAAASRSSR